MRAPQWSFLRKQLVGVDADPVVMRTIHISTPGSTRQTGAALLVFTALLVVISASVLLDQLSNRTNLNIDRERETTAALAEARDALIGWSVSHSQEPGRLPWPDRNGDGSYDGGADCFAGGVSNALLLGRFPYAGDATPCSSEPMGVYPRDGAGEPLFYAVSQNLIQHRGAPGADPGINPGLMDGGASYPWLTVVDQNGNVISNRVAAVLIAPGVALEGQDRSATAPNADQFLDSVTVGATTYDNGDDDLVFIQYPDSRMTAVETDSFNDRLVYVTIDELMRKVEKRVLGDAAVALRTYRTSYGRYPWLSPYRDPTAYTGSDTLTGRIEAVNGGDRLIDNEANFPDDPVLEDQIIVNASRRTSWIIKDQHNPDDIHLKDKPNDFVAGDAYNVRPAFNAIWGQREGHIPYIDTTANETFSFATGFTVDWTGGSAGPITCADPLPGLLLLVTGECAVITANLTAGANATTVTIPPPPAGDGDCIWTDSLDPGNPENVVDCTATLTQNNVYQLDICLDPALGIWPWCPTVWGTFWVNRTYTFSFSYAGAGSATSGGTNGVKTREVSGTAATNQTVTFQDTMLGVWPVSNTVTATIPENQLTLSGIYYDLEDSVEFPGYFFTNDWHHYVYVKISDEHVAVNDAGATSSDNCTAGTDCISLQIGGATARNEIQAVIVGAGGQVTGQDRSNGNLSDYFENNNAVTANDTAERGTLTAAFNDQVRIVTPNPP